MTVDVARRTLSRSGEPIALFPKSFDALVVLLRHRGELLDKEFLLRELWPHSDIEENSLARAISDIRRALGEGPKDQRYVVTVPRVGYRFVADVHASDQTVDTDQAAAPVRSLAVLPFVCMQSAVGDEYLGLGIADSLITRLSTLRRLTVRPTSAIARYTSEAEPGDAGRDLRVDAVVSGTVRRAGSRLRITVQLVSVEREATLWADQFDEESSDVFAIEDSISRRVAAMLLVQLTSHETAFLSRRVTDDNEAYRLFLKGRFFWSRRTEASLQMAIGFYEQAVARDSRFALAYAGMSDCYVALGLQTALAGGSRPRTVWPKAREAALKAIELDDSLGEAHSSLGHILLFHDWDWASSEQLFLRGIALNPSYSSAHHWYAMALSMLERHDDALATIRRARELDPMSLMINGNVGYLLYRARRYDEALIEAQHAVTLDPGFPVNRYRLGLVYQAQGWHDRAVAEYEAMGPSPSDPLGWTALAHVHAVMGNAREAAEIVETLLALRRQRYVSAVFFAEIYAALGRTSEALHWLEQGFEERPSVILSLRVNPKFDVLRGEARYQEIEHRIGVWSSRRSGMAE